MSPEQVNGLFGGSVGPAIGQQLFIGSPVILWLHSHCVGGRGIVCLRRPRRGWLQVGQSCGRGATRWRARGGFGPCRWLGDSPAYFGQHRQPARGEQR
eukprot:4685419-Lingulodinium_polyedra.AAC.1